MNLRSGGKTAKSYKYKIMESTKLSSFNGFREIIYLHSIPGIT